MHMTSKHRKETVEILKQVPKDGGSRPIGVGPKCLDKVTGFYDVYGNNCEFGCHSDLVVPPDTVARPEMVDPDHKTKKQRKFRDNILYIRRSQISSCSKEPDLQIR